jgi:hypothetical protein
MEIPGVKAKYNRQNIKEPFRTFGAESEFPKSPNNSRDIFLARVLMALLPGRRTVSAKTRSEFWGKIIFPKPSG